MSPGLTDLRVFAAAARAGSLSKAARELHITQPAVSERIVRLERIIGRALLIRSSRGVTPTPAGERLLPYAERCIALAARAFDIAQAEDTSFRLHVTAYADYAPVAIPFVVATLRPLTCSITVDDRHSEDALDHIAAGGTDVAFTLPVPHAHEVCLHHFHRDEVIAVCNPHHALAGRPCDLRQLSDHHIAFNNWGTGAQAFTEQFFDQPIKGHQILAVKPAQTSAELARKGLAVGIVTRSTVRYDLETGALVQLHVDDLPDWHVDVMLAHHRNRATEPAIAALINALP